MGDGAIVTRYTEAPESYDGFGTHTIRTVRAVTLDGRKFEFRVVDIDPEYDEWQRQRYLSGCYHAEDERGFAMLYTVVQ